MQVACSSAFFYIPPFHSLLFVAPISPAPPIPPLRPTILHSGPDPASHRIASPRFASATSHTQVTSPPLPLPPPPLALATTLLRPSILIPFRSNRLALPDVSDHGCGGCRRRGCPRTQDCAHLPGLATRDPTRDPVPCMRNSPAQLAYIMDPADPSCSAPNPISSASHSSRSTSTSSPLRFCTAVSTSSSPTKMT